MFEGLRLTTLALLVVPAALFTRRSRAGWQDELDGIRDDALDSPEGELGVAVAEQDPALPDDRSPLAELEAPLPPAVFTPHNPNRPANAQRSLPVLGIEPGKQELPYEPMADEPKMAAPAPIVVEAPAAPPQQAPPQIAPTQPAPHPVRPHEMWHPPVGAMALDLSAELVPEEHVAVAEILAPVDQAFDPGFRFNQLHAAPMGEDEAGVTGLTVQPGTVHNPTIEPLVPAVDAEATGSLIGAPVTRRDRRIETVTPEVHEVESPSPNETVPADVPLCAGPDGMVDVSTGVVRLGDPATQMQRHGDGLEIDLPLGWCWAARPEGAEPVTIVVPTGPLSVPAGTTALAVVEADQSTFVVVVRGEAVLLHAGGRVRLRAGAMALAPMGAEPQVDIATEDEIRTDPLVTSNLALDEAL